MGDRADRFSSRLRGLRAEDNLSQPELAKMLGTTKNTISNYEHGFSTPTLETAVVIADIFGVSLDYLVGKSDDATRRRPS